MDDQGTRTRLGRPPPRAAAPFLVARRGPAGSPGEHPPSAGEKPFRARSAANRQAAAKVYIKAREKAGRPVAPEIRRLADGN